MSDLVQLLEVQPNVSSPFYRQGFEAYEAFANGAFWRNPYRRHTYAHQQWYAGYMAQLQQWNDGGAEDVLLQW